MTEANCQVPRGPEPSWPAMERHGLYRTPRAAVEFDDVMLTWYARQDDAPLIGTRGQLYDHIALSVTDLDAWVDEACTAKASRSWSSPIGSATRVPR